VGSVLVVVIVGVVVAVVTVGAVRRDEKPATRPQGDRLAPARAPGTPPVDQPIAWGEAPVEPVREPEVRGFSLRLRAVVLLAMTVAVLGALVAAVAGAAVYVVAHAVNGALG